MIVPEAFLHDNGAAKPASTMSGRLDSLPIFSGVQANQRSGMTGVFGSQGCEPHEQKRQRQAVQRFDWWPD